jgi:hypothetical protein
MLEHPMRRACLMTIVTFAAAALSGGCGDMPRDAVREGDEGARVRERFGEPGWTRKAPPADDIAWYVKHFFEHCDGSRRSAVSTVWVYDNWLRDDVVLGLDANNIVMCVGSGGQVFDTTASGEDAKPGRSVPSSIRGQDLADAGDAARFGRP